MLSPPYPVHRLFPADVKVTQEAEPATNMRLVEVRIFRLVRGKGGMKKQRKERWYEKNIFIK